MKTITQYNDRSWYEVRCHECGSGSVVFVQVGDPDAMTWRDAGVANICGDCLRKAAALAEVELKKVGS